MSALAMLRKLSYQAREIDRVNTVLDERLAQKRMERLLVASVVQKVETYSGNGHLHSQLEGMEADLETP